MPTFYNGIQEIICSPHSNGLFRLYGYKYTIDGNSVFLHTLRNSSVIPSEEITNFVLFKSVLDVQWGMEKTIEYFMNIHGRDGIDDEEKEINITFFNKKSVILIS